MVLPPVETTPVLLLRFTPKADDGIIKSATAALERGGIVVVAREGGGGGSGGGCTVLGLTTTRGAIESEAEARRVVKRRKTGHGHAPFIMDRFTLRCREHFVNLKRERNDDDYDSEGLFTSAERAMLVESILNAVPVLAPEQSAPASSSTGGAKAGARPLIEGATRKLHDRMGGAGEKALCRALRAGGYVDAVSPVHSPHIARRIIRETNSIFTPPPLDSIRNYYGEEVAFYFAWMDFVTRALVFPGALGFAVYFARAYRGDTVDTCDLTPFVGLATFVWAIVINRLWERREAELAYSWGTFALTDADRVNLGKRPEFEGETRRSPVTGQDETYYPAYKRQLKCLASAIVTCFLLAGACVLMVLFMNLQNYVSRADRELWGDKNHPLYFPLLAQLSEEGGIFDANSWWKSLIPAILRAVVVTNINGQYSRLAVALTEWENHETLQDHRNNIILKRTLFEAFDAYIILFYLAVFERDIHLLRLELVGTFNVDQLRRFFTECALPLATRYYHSKKDAVSMSKKDDNFSANDGGILHSEADLEDYDTFDDYIEMIIEFGYVTLFASAYPLAAFIAMCTHLIEIRTDMFKISRLHQRRSPQRVNGVGMWKSLTQALALLSVFSNLLIFAFTSKQMQQWFPGLYATESDVSSANILLVVLIIEHCLLLFAASVRNFIPKTPKSVCIGIQQMMWHHESEGKKT